MQEDRRPLSGALRQVISETQASDAPGGGGEEDKETRRSTQLLAFEDDVEAGRSLKIGPSCSMVVVRRRCLFASERAEASLTAAASFEVDPLGGPSFQAHLGNRSSLPRV